MYDSITPPEWYRNVIFWGPGPWTIMINGPNISQRVESQFSNSFAFGRDYIQYTTVPLYMRMTEKSGRLSASLSRGVWVIRLGRQK